MATVKSLFTVPENAKLLMCQPTNIIVAVMLGFGSARNTRGHSKKYCITYVENEAMQAMLNSNNNNYLEI